MEVTQIYWPGQFFELDRDELPSLHRLDINRQSARTTHCVNVWQLSRGRFEQL